MTATEPDAAYPLQQGQPAGESLPLRRARGGLLAFIRRSPLSAFWGGIAAAIIVMAIAAPLFAPYEPLKSDFRAMSKPPDDANSAVGIQTYSTGTPIAAEQWSIAFFVAM